MVRLRLSVHDAETNEPLDRCRFSAKTVSEGRTVATFSSASDTGEYDAWLDPGELQFTIEAPDHKTSTVTVDVPADQAEFAYVARLAPTGAETKEVTLSVTVLTESGDPVTRATIDVLDPDGDREMSSFTGEREGGRFTLPAPSGKWRVRVGAKGFVAMERVETLPAGDAPVELEFRLRAE
jgi:hypothetical protein